MQLEFTIVLYFKYRSRNDLAKKVDEAVKHCLAAGVLQVGRIRGPQEQFKPTRANATSASFNITTINPKF